MFTEGPEELLPDKTPSGNPLPNFEAWHEKVYPAIHEIMLESGMPFDEFTRIHAAMACSAAAILSNFILEQIDPENEVKHIGFNLEHVTALAHYFASEKGHRHL